MLYLCLFRLAKELYFLQNAEGSGLAPFDCWLCLRGIKTMALRVEKQQVLLENSLKLVLLFILWHWNHVLLLSNHWNYNLLQENARKIAEFLASLLEWRKWTTLVCLVILYVTCIILWYGQKMKFRIISATLLLILSHIHMVYYCRQGVQDLCFAFWQVHWHSQSILLRLPSTSA